MPNNNIIIINHNKNHFTTWFITRKPSHDIADVFSTTTKNYLPEISAVNNTENTIRRSSATFKLSLRRRDVDGARFVFGNGLKSTIVAKAVD